MSFWRTVSCDLAWMLNIIVALFYPFTDYSARTYSGKCSVFDLHLTERSVCSSERRVFTVFVDMFWHYVHSCHGEASAKCFAAVQYLCRDPGGVFGGSAAHRIPSWCNKCKFWQPSNGLVDWSNRTTCTFEEFHVSVAYLQMGIAVISTVSHVGNKGTFRDGLTGAARDLQFIYELFLIGVCLAGLFVHEFFYSILVWFCASFTLNATFPPLLIVVGYSLSWRDFAQCHQIGHEKWTIHFTHCRSCRYSGLHVFHGWIPFLLRRLFARLPDSKREICYWRWALLGMQFFS